MTNAAECKYEFVQVLNIKQISSGAFEFENKTTNNP